MTPNISTSGSYIRELNLLYLGLLVGQCIFAAITLYLNLGLLFQPDDSLSNVFIFIIPLFVLNGFVTGNYLYRIRLKKLKTLPSLSQKLAEYKSIFIVRLALLEGASLFAIVAYLLTANLVFMAMCGLVIAYFLTLKPGVNRLAVEFELDPSDREKLEHPDTIINI